MKRRVVLVTGSGRGIGASTVEKFASQGYNTIITYVTHEKEALSLKEKVEKEYNIEAMAIKCDISNEEDIKSMFDRVINRFKRIDVLVNNAGYAEDSDFKDKTKEVFMRTLEVNLVGTFLVSRIFGEYMYERKSGCIINISSNNAVDNYNPYSLEYDSSKAGIINMTHNLANHYAPYVRVNAVCPGWTNTEGVKDINPSYKKEEKNKILLNRFAEPYEIASTIYFIATDEASYINDSVIKVDGGIKC